MRRRAWSVRAQGCVTRKWKKVQVAQSCPTLWPRPEFSRPECWSCSLLQGIFPTQGSNPGLLHCGQILHQLSHKGSPKILEWVAYPFSRGSSQPRNWTRVACIVGRFFTNWAIREAMWLQVGGNVGDTGRFSYKQTRTLCENLEFSFYPDSMGKISEDFVKS